MDKGKPRVLVVDDEAANRERYRDWLSELHDVEIVEAPGGREALGLARKGEFAMFLLDVDMKDMDGFELASLLRQEPRAELTPIVFITDQVKDRTYLMRGYRMGAVDFLVNQPVDSEILVQKARIFLQINGKRRELQELVDQVRRENQELHQRLEDFVREQEELRMQATHDSLTKLPNRTLFRDRLEAGIKRAQRSQQRFALAYVDLDGFKAVNDQHGHATGDALLRAVAERLNQAVRGSDTVARLGGDEFAILFEGLDSAAPAVYLSEKVLRALADPVELDSETKKCKVPVRIGASIGIAVFPEHATKDVDLMMLADMTMYEVKRAGGGARVYRPGGEAPQLQLVRRT